MIKLTYGKKGYWLGPHTLANSRAESFSEFSECNTTHSPVLLLSSFVVSPHSQPSWNAAKEEIKGLWMILCSASGLPGEWRGSCPKCCCHYSTESPAVAWLCLHSDVIQAS